MGVVIASTAGGWVTGDVKHSVVGNSPNPGIATLLVALAIGHVPSAQQKHWLLQNLPEKPEKVALSD